MGLKKFLPDSELRIWFWLTSVITLILGVGCLVLFLIGLPDQLFLLIVSIASFAMFGVVCVFSFVLRSKPAIT